MNPPSFTSHIADIDAVPPRIRRPNNAVPRDTFELERNEHNQAYDVSLDHATNGQAKAQVDVAWDKPVALNDPRQQWSTFAWTEPPTRLQLLTYYHPTFHDPVSEDGQAVAPASRLRQQLRPTVDSQQWAESMGLQVQMQGYPPASHAPVKLHHPQPHRAALDFGKILNTGVYPLVTLLSIRPST